MMLTVCPTKAQYLVASVPLILIKAKREAGENPALPPQL